MARPAKAIDTQNRHNTKSEIKARQEIEKSLKSSSNKIKPPSYLTESQVGIFKSIVKELKESDILCNLDIYILTTCSIAIDRLKFIEDSINNDNTLLYSKDLLSAKDKYTKDLYRCCNELSLSPQSRSKIGSLSLQKQKEKKDPLMQILLGGKNES